MQEILRKRHYRSVFYLVVGLILVIVTLIRFLVLPTYDPSLGSSPLQLLARLLDGLAISVIITVFIGSFVFWLTPEIVKRSPIEVLDPKEIGPLLAKAASDTRSWVYRGGCGRYTRAKTLPAIAEAARKEGIGREIRISIMNPNNDLLCKEYATYRKSLKSADKTLPWTSAMVKEELIATIISVLRYQHKEPLLRIHLYLVDHFSAFRLDISDHYVIVTKEDKEAPGLRADRGTYFYDSYKDDVTLTERQSRSISFADDILDSPSLDKSQLQQIMMATELIGEDKVDEPDLERIVEFVNSPSDPYS